MKRIRIYESEAWLKMNFLLRGFTIKEMADMARCSENTIRTNLKKYGIIE
jgi:hypothetical protein